MNSIRYPAFERNSIHLQPLKRLRNIQKYKKEKRDDLMYCLNCGKQIPDAAKFCPYCGASTSFEIPTTDGNSVTQPPIASEKVPTSSNDAIKEREMNQIDQIMVAALKSSVTARLNDPNSNVRIFRNDNVNGNPVNLGVMYIDSKMIGAADDKCDYHLYLSPGKHIATFIPTNSNESKTAQFTVADDDYQEFRILPCDTSEPYQRLTPYSRAMHQSDWKVYLVAWNKKHIENLLDEAKRSNNVARVIMVFGIVSMPILIGFPIFFWALEKINHKDVQYLKDELKRIENMNTVVHVSAR